MPSAISWACGWSTTKSFFAADVVFVATPPAALDDVVAALKGYAGLIVSAFPAPAATS